MIAPTELSVVVQWYKVNVKDFIAFLLILLQQTLILYALLGTRIQD